MFFRTDRNAIVLRDLLCGEMAHQHTALLQLLIELSAVYAIGFRKEEIRLGFRYEKSEFSAKARTDSNYAIIYFTLFFTL